MSGSLGKQDDLGGFSPVKDSKWRPQVEEKQKSGNTTAEAVAPCKLRELCFSTEFTLSPKHPYRKRTRSSIS